jgi:LemA protein
VATLAAVEPFSVGVILGVIVLVIGIVVLYNRLVRLRNRTQNAWAQVDVQLRRRYDLIPNLVEIVKGYAAHERQTFEAVTEARSRAQQASTVEEQAQAENMLTSALRQLFALAEAYPELRASENFRQLQGDLGDTENKIAVARQIYNDATLTYNNTVQVVPSNIVATLFRFKVLPYFETEGDSRSAPEIRF